MWNSFKDILVRKEDNNTLQDSKDRSKKQPINIRDDFWLVHSYLFSIKLIITTISELTTDFSVDLNLEFI